MAKFRLQLNYHVLSSFVSCKLLHLLFVVGKICELQFGIFLFFSSSLEQLDYRRPLGVADSGRQRATRATTRNAAEPIEFAWLYLDLLGELCERVQSSHSS